MIPVEQRRLWRPDDHPDGPQRGDCMRACVASIFETSYEDAEGIDGTTQTLFDWVRPRYPGIRARCQQLTGNDPETLESYKQWPTTHWEDGYWIAAVWSPRIPDREEFGCGCPEHTEDGKPDPDCRWCHGKPETRSMGIFWGLHAVVMRGGELAWDPHPERTGTVGPFQSATTFVAVDVGRLIPRCVKGACGEGLVDSADCYHRRVV